MRSTRTFRIILTVQLLALVALLSCATHQTSNDKSAGVADFPIPGPGTNPAEKVRGPVVLTMVEDTAQEDKILKKTNTFSYSSQTGRASEQALIQNALQASLTPMRAGTLPTIVDKVRQGNPVAVLWQANEKEAPRFDLIIGVKIGAEKLVIDSNGERRTIEFSEFFSGWRKGNFYARYFLSPNEIKHSDDLRAVFSQALAMETFNPLGSRKVLRKLIELDRSQPDFYIALANNLALRHPGKAARLLQKALKFEPNRFEAWYNLAAYQEAAGLRNEARRTSKKIVAMFGKAPVPKAKLDSIRLLAGY